MGKRSNSTGLMQPPWAHAASRGRSPASETAREEPTANASDEMMWLPGGFHYLVKNTVSQVSTESLVRGNGPTVSPLFGMFLRS